MELSSNKKEKIFFDRYHYLILFIISSILTIISIHYLLTHYRLVTFPGYDDVAYFNNSANWLETFFQKGPRGLLKTYITQPPHSVVSVVQGFLGYLIFGYTTWAPYTTNVIIIFTLLIFADRWVHTLSWRLRLSVSLFVCTLPFCVLSVCEFRPDFYWGVFTAFGTMIPIAESWLYKTKRYQVYWGILLGAALLAKPSICPATIVFFGCSWLLSLLLIKNKNEEIVAPKLSVSTCLKSIGWLSLAAILIAGPYYIFAYHDVIGYIYQALISNKDVWDVPLSLKDTLAYYIIRPAGVGEIGYHSLIILSLMIVSFIVACCKRNTYYIYKFVLLNIMVFILYIVPTLVTLKNPFLGAAFTCGLLFLGLFCLNYIFKTIYSLKNRGVHFLNILAATCMFIILLAGIIGFRWPHSSGTQTDIRKQHENQLFKAIYQDMKLHFSDQSVTVLTTIAGPMIMDGFQLKAKMDGYFNVNFFDLSLSRGVHDITSYLNTADLILAQEDDVDGASPNLSSFSLQGTWLNILKHSPQFHVVNEYSAFNGKKLVLFERERNFYNINALLGVIIPQDVFPTSHPMNKEIWWGMGYVSQFTLINKLSTFGTLNIGFKVLVPSMLSVDIYLDNKKITTIKTKEGLDISLNLPINLQNNIGQHVVAFQYHYLSNYKPTADEKVVAFNKIQFMPQSSMHSNI